jgi:predicted 3-demethylubiquinone-9 3-methyltransferase (glyoxalase superfamily)
MEKITTCLWFDHQAEEAAEFYASVFRHSAKKSQTRYGKAGFEVHKQPDGSVMTVEFEIEGRTFIGLNGGPAFQFNEAISFQVMCADQAEIDHYWSKLSEGGDPSAQQCGWLKDRFGVSWQIIPEQMGALVGGPDGEGSQRAMKAMLQMKKIDIGILQKAYAGDS